MGYFKMGENGEPVPCASPEADRAKYLLWLDTYNAALTGLLSGRVTVLRDGLRSAEGMHTMASELANALHGEQS